MPNTSKSSQRPEAQAPSNFEVTRRIMDTISRQVESYQLSLGYVVNLREEARNNPKLMEKMKESPEAMVEVLESRGIPAALAYGMASEDYGGVDFGGAGQLALWTWDCCCTHCCITCVVTSIR